MANELTTQKPGFALALTAPVQGLSQQERDMLAEMDSDLDPDVKFTFTRIKPPGAGGVAFTIFGDTPESTRIFQTIDAVVIRCHKANAYWNMAQVVKGSSPLCSSNDGKYGIRRDTGERIPCAACPYNQYGSARNADGSARKGKACKNSMQLYLMMENDPEIYIMTAPPTSVKEINVRLKKIISSGRGYNSVVFRFSLKPIENGPNPYSQIIMTPIQDVSPADKAALDALYKDIKGIQVDIGDMTVDDYNLVDEQGQPIPEPGKELPWAPAETQHQMPTQPQRQGAPVNGGFVDYHGTPEQIQNTQAWQQNAARQNQAPQNNRPPMNRAEQRRAPNTTWQPPQQAQNQPPQPQQNYSYASPPPAENWQFQDAPPVNGGGDGDAQLPF